MRSSSKARSGTNAVPARATWRSPLTARAKAVRTGSRRRGRIGRKSLLVIRVSLPFALHKPVPLEGEPSLGQPSRPSVAGTDAAGVVEQAVLFLLSREPGAPGPQWIVGSQEGVFAVQDGWIGALGVISTIDLPDSQVEPNRPQERRVRIFLESGVHQIGKLAGPPMDLHDVGAFRVAEIGSAAALVDAQERFESIQGIAVDIEAVGPSMAQAMAWIVSWGSARMMRLSLSEGFSGSITH